MDGRIGEVICESVLLQIRKAHSRERRQQRGTGIDGAIVDRVPNRPSRLFDVGGLVDLPEVLDGVEVADDAFGAVVALRDSTPSMVKSFSTDA